MGKFQVVEWKIENIRCWRQDVHGEYIQSPDFIFLHYRNADFYPRGVDGRQKRMAVRLIAFESWFSGELSFIGPDGLPLGTPQKVSGKGESVLEDGPEFEQVVGKANGDDHLILRFSFMSNYDHVQRMCTTINVSRLSLRIDPKTIQTVESEHNNSLKDLEQLELKTVRTDGTVKLVFHRGNGVMDNMWVESRVSLLKSDDSLVRYAKKEHVLRDIDPWTFSDALNVEELVEKAVTILVNVKIANGNIGNSYNHLLYHSKGVTIEPSVTTNRCEDSTTALKSNFKGLYRDRDFSDFTLKCDNVSFPVHKVILSARSPVFKTMLSTDMTEAASGTVDIGDLDPSILGLFLTYLYTGAVEDLESDRALKLYYAAHKYQVPSLKGECSMFLSDNVSVSNVCDVLTLAHKHEDEALLSAVWDFIRNHFGDVSCSEEWKKFAEKEPLLAEETRTTTLCAGVGKIDIK